MRHIPNMVLMMPKDENELRHMMKTALDYDRRSDCLPLSAKNVVGVPLDDVLVKYSYRIWEHLRPG